MAGVRHVRVVRTKHDTYRLDYTSPDGRRRRLSAGKDEQHAQRLAVKYTDWLLEGKDPEREIKRAEREEQYRTITLREFFPDFMKRHGSKLRPETVRSYHRAFKNISRAGIKLGGKEARLIDLYLMELRKVFVEDYRQDRMENDGVKPATVNRELELLKCMLNRAVAWDMIERNPLQGLRPLKEKNRRDVSNITPDMLERLLEALPDSIANIVEFALYTGWRKENILGLKIEQVILHDLDATGEARITSKGDKQECKMLGRSAVEVFRRATRGRTNGYVFLNPNTGNRYKAINRTLDRAIYKLNLRIVDGRKLCFHDFRRICATWMLNGGRSLDEVREVLGHADRKTTDRYARLRIGSDVYDSLPRLRAV